MAYMKIDQNNGTFELKTNINWSGHKK